MGILSTSVSITQYHVDGQLQKPVVETVGNGLKKQAIKDIDHQDSDKSIGWACFNDPFSTDFDRSPYLIGTYLVFSMRMDRKSIPTTIVQKHVHLETKKRLKRCGREFLSRTERKEIKDHVLQLLYLRIPATPHIYDLIWNYEANSLWFFSNLKGPNEELETLFTRSFKLKLIRLFPYTMVALRSPLSDGEKDAVAQLSPTRFTE